MTTKQVSYEVFDKALKQANRKIAKHHYAVCLVRKSSRNADKIVVELEVSACLRSSDPKEVMNFSEALKVAASTIAEFPYNGYELHSYAVDECGRMYVPEMEIIRS